MVTVYEPASHPVSPATPTVDGPLTSFAPIAFAAAISPVMNARMAALPLATGACGGISTPSSAYRATIFSTSPALNESSHVLVAALSAAASALVSTAVWAAEHAVTVDA